MKSYLSLPGEVTPTSLLLPSRTSFEEWLEIGDRLQKAEQGLMWWIGDWWAFGDHKYGERASQFADPDKSEYSFQTLADAGWVSRQIETSRRREVLSWSHHKEVAALEPEEQERFLNAAAEHGLSQKDLRKAVLDYKRTKDKLSAPPLPEGKFRLIYGDPPWRYEHVKTESRAIENQYPTLELAEIQEYKDSDGKTVPDIAAEDSILFLWATSPKLTEAISVIEAWGFTYRTNAVWDKEVIGMGYYFRQQHELLLVAIKGEPPTPDPELRISSVIRSKRSEHSAKPAEIYSILEDMYPAYSEKDRVELFSRIMRPGWTSWGNHVHA